jgi:F0F1-type ATP synthase assembly protein I
LERKKGSNPLLLVMVITAAVVTPLVLLGIYLGYYVGGVIGYSKSILAIVFSTLGFLAAMAVVVKAIVMIVARSAKSRP